jgi:CubicO group peptidase (beta-lactamase class C family)
MNIAQTAGTTVRRPAQGTAALASLALAFLAAASLMLAPAPALAEPTPLTSSADRVVNLARQAGLSGQIVLGDTSGARASRTLGLANRETNRPHRNEDRWLWASNTKFITGILVMQQVEAGRLSLEAPVRQFLPDFKGATGDRITLRQLLQHRSGLPNPNDTPLNASETPEFYTQTGAQISDRARALGYCAGPVRAEPGDGFAAFAYNNCDYLVLGAILEAVTGKSYAALLRDQISRPLGLKTIKLAPDKAPGGGATATGYLSGKPYPPVNVATLGAGGAITGSAADMMAIDIALMNGRLLSPAGRATLWQGDPALGYQALGVWSFPAELTGCKEPVALIERRGDFAGVQVRNLMAPERGRALVVLINEAEFDFGEIWQGRGPAFDLASAAFCPE